MAQVVLREKSFEHFVCAPFFGVAREEILVAQVVPAADHHEVHARHPGDAGACDDVGVAAGFVRHELFFAYFTQRGDLVARKRGFFVIHPLRSVLHA
jgi:hypothetical protein